MNNAPLQLAPQYSTPENGGRAATQYYPDKGPNITEISYRMWESVVTVNEAFAYKTPYEFLVARRYPGAHIAVFDSYSFVRMTIILIVDIQLLTTQLCYYRFRICITTPLNTSTAQAPSMSQGLSTCATPQGKTASGTAAPTVSSGTMSCIQASKPIVTSQKLSLTL
jgi:hypothetical protein